MFALVGYNLGLVRTSRGVFRVYLEVVMDKKIDVPGVGEVVAQVATYGMVCDALALAGQFSENKEAAEEFTDYVQTLDKDYAEDIIGKFEDIRSKVIHEINQIK